MGVARVIGAVAVVVLLCGTARAEEELAPEAAVTPLAERTLRLSLGTGLMFGLSDVEEQRSDVVGVSQAAYRWNVVASAGYRASAAWALGLRGSWSSDAGARSRGVELARELWQLGIEARLQPGGWVGPYAALNAGAAAAIDREGGRSVTQWAPALGAGAGYAFVLFEPVVLDAGLAGGLAFFDDAGATLAGPEPARYRYGTSTWLGATVLATVPF